MDILLIFIELAITFFVIGAFTFGGGYAMLSLIQAQVVTAHCWITEIEFTNILAISQMTPGPIGINTATYVGYQVMQNAGASHLLSILGSVTASLAVVLPSFLIMLAIVRCYEKFYGNSVFEGVMQGLRPAIVGLIGAAAVILIVGVSWDGVSPKFEIIRENFIDWKSWVLFGAAFIASFRYKINPIILILLGGIMGLLIY